MPLTESTVQWLADMRAANERFDSVEGLRLFNQLPGPTFDDRSEQMAILVAVASGIDENDTGAIAEFVTNYLAEFRRGFHDGAETRMKQNAIERKLHGKS